MDRKLETIWDSINNHIEESRILTMLSEENLANDIDYIRYLECGCSLDDVAVGFELIRIYKSLQRHLKNYE